MTIKPPPDDYRNPDHWREIEKVGVLWVVPAAAVILFVTIILSLWPI